MLFAFIISFLIEYVSKSPEELIEKLNKSLQTKNKKMIVKEKYIFSFFFVINIICNIY